MDHAFPNPSIIDLIDGYKRVRRGLKYAYEACESISDKQTIGGMIRSITYAIDLMESGCFPRRKRALNRQSYLQRTIFMDDKLLDVLANRYRQEVQTSITAEQRRMIDEKLKILTTRERDCFLAVYGQNLSFAEAADMIGITKSSVGTYISRVQKKLGIKLNKAS